MTSIFSSRLLVLPLSLPFPLRCFPNSLRTSFGAALSALVLAACGGQIADSPQAAAKAQRAEAHAKASTIYFPSAYAGVVQELYVAYFGRPADSAGLTNFENALSTAGAPIDIGSLVTAYATNPQIKALVDGFGNSKESASLYGSGTTSDFVTAVFKNVLNRPPAQAGLNFWVTAIDDGSLTKGDAALAIMAGALGNTTAQGVLDAQLVNNKIAVATNFTALFTTSVETAAYSGSAAATGARNMLAGVSGSADPASYNTELQALLATLVATAPTYVLSGTVEGLQSNSSLTLTNGAETVTVGTNGQFSFGQVPNGAQYSLTLTQPQGQICSISNGVGTVNSSSVSNLSVSCILGFSGANGLAVDSADNVYVADSGHNLIRKVTQDGTISTLGGTLMVCGAQDGPLAQASFCNPNGIAIDAAGNLYVADTGNHVIRKIDTSGVVSTLAGTAGVKGGADGTGPAASFTSPYGVAVDAGGNVYVSDIVVNTVRKITPAGVVTTLAGTSFQYGHTNGVGSVATFDFTQAIAVDAAGDVYVTDVANEMIRAVTPAGLTTLFAGNGYEGAKYGAASNAEFAFPEGIATDKAGNVYVADTGNSVIAKIDTSGNVSVFAGNGYRGNSDGYGPTMNQPAGIAVDSNGIIFVSDIGNNCIRKVTSQGYVTTLAGPLLASGTPASTAKVGTAGTADKLLPRR